jgi:hypothetical protein
MYLTIWGGIVEILYYLSSEFKANDWRLIFKKLESVREVLWELELWWWWGKKIIQY